MNKTDIEYLDYTWNPTHGCTAVDGGCTNCWAKRMSKRLAGMGVPGYSKDDPFAVTCHLERLNEPMKVKKPSRIGVSFMGDLFHEDVPFEFIDEVMGSILDTIDRHTFMILTKRPKRMVEYFHHDPWSVKPEYMDHLYRGVSIHDQASADSRIPELLELSGGKLFVSQEPALGMVDYRPFLVEYHSAPGSDPHLYMPAIDLIITGGESGPGAKPMHPDIPRSTRDQCLEAEIKFHFKQWGEWLPSSQMEIGKVYDHNCIQGRGWNYFDDFSHTFRVGKKAAGRRLDGVLHDG